MTCSAIFTTVSPSWACIRSAQFRIQLSLRFVVFDSSYKDKQVVNQVVNANVCTKTARSRTKNLPIIQLQHGHEYNISLVKSSWYCIHGPHLGYVEIITSHCKDPYYPAKSKGLYILLMVSDWQESYQSTSISWNATGYLLRLLTWQISGFLADEIRIPFPTRQDHSDLESKLQSIQLARQSWCVLVSAEFQISSSTSQAAHKEFSPSIFRHHEVIHDLLCHLCPTSWIAPAPGRVCLDNRQNVENLLFWSILKSLPKGRKSILALCLHLQLIHESNHPTQSIPSSQFKFIRSQVFYVRRKTRCLPKKAQEPAWLVPVSHQLGLWLQRTDLEEGQQSNSNAA